ncbi:SusC/RagA family TonB-linked outer membrane protein [Hymenobacter crusticola]|uniref:SusC/RagA family TonB-linked outer membrane protein n=1 Tax=Hymenobacter crusticola TaxID=1770526 RepID=A0A243W7G6_9BACT|nr:TonB-dependent receptor [Hymenobacter crusticola]OUJ71025.1 SusC/RagA family TonB-linked outer membrane protein [Hymenobacter crusticola]
MKKILLQKVQLLSLALPFALLPGIALDASAAPRVLVYQAAPVTGQVTDQKGEPLPGVTVRVKDQLTATVTDAMGNYSLTLPAGNTTLVFSFVGFVNQEVAVQSGAKVNVRLNEQAHSLNEVVVVGFGTQKKTSTTAAVSTLPAADIAQKPVVNVTNSLAGRVAGVISTQGGGEPGFDGANIQIRGIGTTGGTQPLYIVDNVPRDFSRLDPNTIETITVLKDAAAVAPYGVAGANGVVLVTTKRGRKGPPQLSYNAYVGIQNPTRLPTFVNSYQYALMRNATVANDFPNDPTRPLPYSDDDLRKFQDHSDPDGHPDGQPLRDIIKKNRLLTYHNISLTGGGDKVSYFASLGYTRQNGMWDPTFLNKYNGSLSVTAEATKTTRVSLSVNSWLEDQHFPSFGAGSILRQAHRQAPTTPVRYSNGLPTGYIGESLIGEIYGSGNQVNQNPTTQIQFLVEQQLPLKGLSLKGTANYDPSSSLQRRYTTPITFYNVDTSTNPYTYKQGTQGSAKPSFFEYYAQDRALTFQGYLNYAKSFGKSEVTGLAVVEWRTLNHQQFQANRINYNTSIDELDFGGPAAADATNGGTSFQTKQLGYIYRVTYAYADKYLLEASGRYDGSYIFAPGQRFGFFPAFSAGWRLSEEAFLKDRFGWLDNLKLRASWGQSGAYPYINGNIAAFEYLSPYSPYSPAGVLDGSTVQGLYEVRQGNPSITWERANKTDIGIEANLWHNALSLEADLFYEKRANVLTSRTSVLPGEYGIGVGLVNAGVIKNRGIDLTLRTSRHFAKDWNLDVTGTFTYAHNTLVNVFENSATYNNPNRRITGRPIGTQFGLEALGYFTPDDFTPDGNSLKPGVPVPSFGPVRAGDIRYADLNGDGKIDVNDQTVIGRSQTPQIIYGLAPRLSFKNFDLDFLIQGTARSNIYLNNIFVWPFEQAGSATTLAFEEYWRPDRTNTLYPRLTGTPTANNTQGSSWWIRNGAFVRLKSAEFGYTFDSAILHNSLKSVRLYVSGQNLLTWTPYIREIIDPDNAGDNRNYYQQQVFSLGLNANF